MKKPVERSGAADLNELRREFARVRAEQGGGRGVRYPEALKERAALALQTSHRPEEVLEACGVPQKSICRWMEHLRPARELRVAPEMVTPCRSRPVQPVGNAMIHLGEGRIRVEVPVAALSEDLLRKLQVSVGGAA